MMSCMYGCLQTSNFGTTLSRVQGFVIHRHTLKDNVNGRARFQLFFVVCFFSFFVFFVSLFVSLIHRT